jgi:hypothetical protein
VLSGEAAAAATFSLPRVFPAALFVFTGRGGAASSFSIRFARVIAAWDTTSFFGTFRFAPAVFFGRAFLSAVRLTGRLLGRFEVTLRFARDDGFAMTASMNLHRHEKQYESIPELFISDGEPVR